MELIRYHNYDIMYNLYGRNEYSVHYISDDCMFDTLDKAKQFVNEIMEGEK